MRGAVWLVVLARTLRSTGDRIDRSVLRDGSAELNVLSLHILTYMSHCHSQADMRPYPTKTKQGKSCISTPPSRNTTDASTPPAKVAHRSVVHRHIPQSHPIFPHHIPSFSHPDASNAISIPPSPQSVSSARSPPLHRLRLSIIPPAALGA